VPPLESSDPSVATALVLLLAIAAAACVHWLAQRAGRRVAVILGRRAGGAPDAGARWRLRLERILLVPIVALWGATLYWVSEQVPYLRAWRLLLVCLVQDSFTAPLFKMGEMSYSALDLLLIPGLVVGLWIAMGLGTRLARLVLFRASAMQSGAQETLGMLVRVFLTFVGVVMIFQYWGIDVSSLAVLGGALGVGIGFGLQTIANNFVSGVVLGLERPIKPGDYVQVGDLVGSVARIGARSTEIRTNDGVSILVPNSRLLEHEVVNWSHEDPTSRVHLPVQVAYDAELRAVRTVLLEAARHHPDVLADPRPDVEVRGFGESGIDLELLVWTRDPRNQVKLRSDLYYRVDAALRRHGIAVPSPQRDVHVHAPELERAVAAWRRREFPERADDAVDATAPIDSAAQDDPAARTDPAPGMALTASRRGGIATASPNGAAGGVAHRAVSDATARHAHDDEPELGGGAWDETRLAALVARMRGPDGLAIVDRRHLLRVYPRCFLGREAVDWLVDREQMTRAEAVALGQRLVAHGLVRHVLDEHDFKDAPLFYRFRADDAGASRAAAAGI